MIPDNNSPVPCLTDNRVIIHDLDTQPHPDFAFQHPYSMMVVGPSQCGKTHFVHQLLTHKCTVYPYKKPVRVVWYYNQWQPQYEEIQRDLGSNIRFIQGVPEFEENLSDIKSSKHTIIVLDDLMAQATDSPVVSKLFTQGRHRNASVILLLQNMFPKGKYNTDISRNATYKVLFRSPGDRKQIDIMAEQTFAKDRPRFMQAYKQETDRPYGYLVVDNHPRTSSEHQVVANVLGDCYTYPRITSTTPPSQTRVEPLPPPLPEQPVTITRKRKVPVTNQSSIKKRKTNDKRVRKRPAPFLQAAKKRKAVQKAPVITQPKKRQAVSIKKKKSNKRKPVPIKKRKLQKKPARKQPVYDSSDEEDEEIVNPKTKRELEQSWLRFSEQEETDSEEEEEETDDEPDPEEDEGSPEEQQENQHGGIWQKPGFRYYCQSRGGGGRTVYEDEVDFVEPNYGTSHSLQFRPRGKLF